VGGKEHAHTHGCSLKKKGRAVLHPSPSEPQALLPSAPAHSCPAVPAVPAVQVGWLRVPKEQEQQGLDIAQVRVCVCVCVGGGGGVGGGNDACLDVCCGGLAAHRGPRWCSGRFMHA
jgi:hypothetical protein